MIRNNNEQHILTTICSLKKSLLNAKLKGKLLSSEIYVLNIIYNLLLNCENSLGEDNKKKLSALYNYIFYNYSNICKRYDISSSLNKSTPIFKQNSSTITSTIPSSKYINYWQEVSYNTTFEDVKVLASNPAYPQSKLKATYDNFILGITISYTNIGRICFVLEDTVVTDDYRIYDILKNDVTSIFDIFYDEVNKYHIFVSKNIYSYGDIFFTINKYNL